MDGRSPFSHGLHVVMLRCINRDGNADSIGFIVSSVVAAVGRSLV